MLPVLWNYIIVKINISLSQDAHMGDCQHDCQHVKKVDATVEPTPFQKSFFSSFLCIHGKQTQTFTLLHHLPCYNS